ncbi:MAG: LPS export ABC transporter periplasmic protein LptC [Alphaproteobacteria bacterium]
MSSSSESFGRRETPDDAGSAPERLAGFIAGRAAAPAARTGRYSAFVGVMRYALPLSAVLLLGLIVVWPLVSGREDGFRVTYSTSVQEDGSLKMLNARYIGTDDKGQPYTVTAVEAVPNAVDTTLVSLKTLAADMFVKDGSWLAMTANEGLYDRDASTLDLAGDVTLFSDEGHELHTESAHIEIAAGTADGDRPVAGQGPLGLIEGDAFRVTERGDNLFLFGNVKVTVFPKGANEAGVR